MLYIVAQYRLANVMSVLFGGELGGMHSYHDNLVGVLLF